MASRLPAHLEVGALLRRAEAQGGFGTVLRRGDPERGAIMLVIISRGLHLACLERMPSIDGQYRWGRTGPPESASAGDMVNYLARRAKFDEDLWCLELDIADAERFIAETTSSG